MQGGFASVPGSTLSCQSPSSWNGDQLRNFAAGTMTEVARSSLNVFAEYRCRPSVATMQWQSGWEMSMHTPLRTYRDESELAHSNAWRNACLNAASTGTSRCLTCGATGHSSMEGDSTGCSTRLPASW